MNAVCLINSLRFDSIIKYLEVDNYSIFFKQIPCFYKTLFVSDLHVILSKDFFYRLLSGFIEFGEERISVESDQLVPLFVVVEIVIICQLILHVF